MNLEEFPTSESAKRFLSYVTAGWYDNSYTGKWMYQVMGMESDRAKEYIESLPYQFFPETASWGIYIHELNYGIPLHTGMDIDERRKIVLNKRDSSRRLPMTPYRMETLIESEYGLNTHVTEDNAHYLFNVDIIVDIDGKVPLSGDLIKYIRKIKPSHMAIDMKYAVGKIDHRNREHFEFDLMGMLLSVGKFGNEVPCVDIIIEIDMNTNTYSGNVMKYKNLNQWNGVYNFDGTIYFDTEIIEEEL